MKKKTFARLFGLCLSLVALPAWAISIDVVTVGNSSNPSDPNDGDDTADGIQNYGAVNYVYAIGKYEVTLLQYTAFLNAVAATDTYSLYNASMGTDLNIRGISQSGTSGNYSYAVIGDGNRPVTYVSWFDAARFTNWLHNGQPTGLQNASTTEQGAYALNGATSGVGFSKSLGAQYWIPSENEWYKAAYYDPTPGAGGGDNYWLYPTQSNSRPNSRNGSTSDANSANLYTNDGLANGFNGGFATTNASSYSSSQSYLTPVGAFTQADSYYGTFDQGGNVWELVDETRFRGGGWGFEYGLEASEPRALGFGEPGPNEVGFRIATVPEPSSALLLVGAGLGLLLRRGRD